MNGNLLVQVIKMIKSPKDGVLNFVLSQNKINAIILLVIQAIVTGLYYGRVLQWLSASILYGWWGDVYLYSTNGFKCFLVAMLCSIIANITLCICFKFLSKGNPISLLLSFCMTMTKTSVTIPITLIAWILSLMSSTLGSIVIVISMAVGILYNYKAYGVVNVNDNKKTVHFIITYIVADIIMVILGIVLCNIFGI